MEQKIIAVVAGREIKESDFEKFLQNVPREQQAYLSNPQFRQQCLDQFVALHMFAELGADGHVDFSFAASSKDVSPLWIAAKIASHFSLESVRICFARTVSPFVNCCLCSS